MDWLLAMSENIDYTEPTKGMGAVRMRILRAEMQAGCALPAPNAVADGDESTVEHGGGGRPQTTSTCAMISA